VGPSTPTVQNRRFQDASIGENTTESRTTIGEGRQRGVAGAAAGDLIAARSASAAPAFKVWRRKVLGSMPAYVIRADRCAQSGSVPVSSGNATAN
jgi:hypothetical protein